MEQKEQAKGLDLGAFGEITPCTVQAMPETGEIRISGGGKQIRYFAPAEYLEPCAQLIPHLLEDSGMITVDWADLHCWDGCRISGYQKMEFTAGQLDSLPQVQLDPPFRGAKGLLAVVWLPEERGLDDVMQILDIPMSYVDPEALVLHAVFFGPQGSNLVAHFLAFDEKK